MEGRAAGVIYEGEDAEAIAGAVLAALEDLPALSTAARERASRWKESQSLEPFLDWFEGEVARRRSVGHLRYCPRGRVASEGREWF
jgi:hypothetical protein